MNKIALALTACLVAGCAKTSPVMDAGSGNYLISAYASRARGGAAGATTLAYQDAQAYCAGKGMTAVVLQNAERDVYQSSSGGYVGPTGGGFGSSSSAAGNVEMYFTCH